MLTGVRDAELPATSVGTLPSPARRLVAVLDIEDPAFRRAVRLGLAAGLAGLAAALLDLGRAYWPVFSVVVIFNAPAPQDWRRALERLGGTVLGFFVALPLIELIGTSQALAMAVALALLWPGLVLMPINYAAAMVFVTATVGLMFAAGGTVDDFVSYRVEDTLLGAAIAAGIGLLLWHTKRRDWFSAARRMAIARPSSWCGRWPDPPPPRSTILSRSWRAYARSPRRARQRPRRPRCRRRRQPPARNSPRWRPPPANCAGTTRASPRRAAATAILSVLANAWCVPNHPYEIPAFAP